MKVKVPKTIRIGALDYDIGFQRNLRLRTDYLGTCDYQLKEISIDPEYPKTLVDTFLHEVIHMICENYKLPFRSNEDMVNRLAHGFKELFDALDIELLIEGLPQRQPL